MTAKPRGPATGSTGSGLDPGLPRRRFPLYQSGPIVNTTIHVFAKSKFEPDESTPGSLPASPLIAPFGPPDRRKWPPVGPRRQASGKWLISTALSKVAGAHLSAESMIWP